MTGFASREYELAESTIFSTCASSIGGTQRVLFNDRRIAISSSFAHPSCQSLQAYRKNTSSRSPIQSFRCLSTSYFFSRSVSLTISTFHCSKNFTIHSRALGTVKISLLFIGRYRASPMIDGGATTYPPSAFKSAICPLGPSHRSFRLFPLLSRRYRCSRPLAVITARVGKSSSESSSLAIKLKSSMSNTARLLLIAPQMTPIPASGHRRYQAATSSSVGIRDWCCFHSATSGTFPFNGMMDNPLLIYFNAESTIGILISFGLGQFIAPHLLMIIVRINTHK